MNKAEINKKWMINCLRNASTTIEQNRSGAANPGISVLKRSLQTMTDFQNFRILKSS